VSVLHGHADVAENGHGAAAERFAEHEGRRGVIAGIVRAINIPVLGPLPEEVLDLAERPERYTGRPLHPLGRTPENRVG
jgi:hypothetical protein